VAGVSAEFRRRHYRAGVPVRHVTPHAVSGVCGHEASTFRVSWRPVTRSRSSIIAARPRGCDGAPIRVMTFADGGGGGGGDVI